jgi:hypothetical protein
VARKIKANDLGKLSRTIIKAEKQERPVKLETDPDDEPWKDRIQSGRSRQGNKVLAKLSD